MTVVAAFSWRYAWTPGTGYLANLLAPEQETAVRPVEAEELAEHGGPCGTQRHARTSASFR